MTRFLQKGQRITGKERERLAKLLAERYNNGSSLRELVELTGRSYGFVHRLLSESGVTFPRLPQLVVTRARGFAV